MSLPDNEAPTTSSDRYAQKSAVTGSEEATMFCLDDGPTLDALFVFAAFAIVFAIGLGLGVLVRGP
jgi:hypothetical protein